MKRKSFAVAGLWAAALWGQTAATTTAVLLNPKAVPLTVRNNVIALGNRLQQPGNEREVIVGTLVQGDLPAAAVVTTQLPNQVRIEITGATPHSVGFDGTRSWSSAGTASEAEEDLLESMLDDSAEGLLYSLQGKASIRTVATYARMTQVSGANAPVLMADIHQIMGPAQSRAARPMRTKDVFFDSVTHLLIETDYRMQRQDGSTAAVRVERSNWTRTAGQMSTGTITRMEDGKAVFSFTARSVTFAPAASDGKFSAP